MSFEIIHKPTFTNQLLAISKEYVVQVLEKIEVLRDDPKPHGNLKKKLHGYKGDVYRLRSGDYRIIYTYGDRWIMLLGVDARKDVYKGDKLVADSTELDISNLPDVADILTVKPTPTPQINTIQTTTKETPLPTQLNQDLLTRLLVPPELFTSLCDCRTLEDLIAVNIPNELRDRLFDCIYSPNFDQVLNQPTYLTGSTDDLLRFKEGELLGFLLKLNPEQEKYVTWAINSSGPTLLKGSPGTGKSTVALYRVRALLQILKANGITQPKILFTTYTNALVSFSQQLLESLLGSDVQYVEVKTADAIALSVVGSIIKDLEIASSEDLRKLMKRILPLAIESLTGNLLQCQVQAQTLERLSIDYLIEEINSVIEARSITTLVEYLVTPRTGRTISLNQTQRKAIWHLREHFYKNLSEKKLITWSQIRSRALSLIRTNQYFVKYDAVVVDEAQDLEATVLCLLTNLCQLPNRLFITADANQSIYGSSFRWQDVHQDLNFVGRTGILKINHRTTQEISEAAHNYLAEGILDDAMTTREYIYNGPPPAVRCVTNQADELALLIRFCQAAAHEFRLGISACAILTPTDKAGKKLADQLSYQGLKAYFMTSKDLDLKQPGVKVLPLKSAKGLEFPIVAIAGFEDSTFPMIPKGTPADAMAEIFSRERRSLFVAMTRAMRALLIIVPSSDRGTLLQDFDPQQWNLGN